MKRLLTAAALLPILALAACDRKPAATEAAIKPEAVAPAAPSATTAPDPAAANFQHDPKLDASGYYLTHAAVQSGDWKLKSIDIGAPSDFAAWEDGKRPANYGPIFLEFEDVSSPTAENELGQVYHTVSFRLMPDGYRVDGREVVFRATDDRLGEVIFSGMFDLEALKVAKAAGPGQEARTVLTGGLQIGAEQFRNISFFFFAGD